jgi:hypothetical protein
MQRVTILPVIREITPMEKKIYILEPNLEYAKWSVETNLFK